MSFQYQDSLPKLPIPNLALTCQKYLKFLKPLQSDSEYKHTVQAVDEFLHGVGPVLDSHLREYASTRNSYIEQFWYDSYLNYDSPVVLNLNPFFLLEDDPLPSMNFNPQIKRASSLTASSLKFVRALRRNELPPDKLKNGTPLCMYQYSRLFGSARIPTETGCVMQSDSQSQHIVVLSKSQFYWFDVLDQDNDLILSEEELVLNYKSIIDDSFQTSVESVAKQSLGILTTENRRNWASLRDKIQLNKINSEILKIVDSALFIVCLDDIEIDNLADLSKNMLCGLSILDKGVQVGTCTNRWYDKLQIIVTKNGKAGINFEHTGVDGHTVLRFVSDIYTDSILKFAGSINRFSPSLWSTQSPDPKTKVEPPDSIPLVKIPRKLEWDTTSELSLASRFAETRLSDLIQQNEFQILEFKNYGMNKIKAMGMSPDAFIQMSFQAAYYALYGKVECTYEPAMTKQFCHGRTEAIRTVSQESNLFVRKFFENIPAAKKLDYLKSACKAHSSQTRDASQGLGVDRHLYALFCIWKRYVDVNDLENDDNSEHSEETVVDQSSSSKNISSHYKSAITKQIPSLFADKGWDKLNTTIISTSNCGNPSLRIFGFGPVSANGFGIGYIIKDDSIAICVSSKHRQTKRFLTTLNSYYLEIERLFKESKVASAAIANTETKGKTIAPTKENKVGTGLELVGAKLQNMSLKSPVSEKFENSTTIDLLLGGYGYFDVGENEIKARGISPEPPFNRRYKDGFSVREIGKKLRLSEY